MADLKSRLARVLGGGVWSYLLLFAVAVILRGLPEMLVASYPVGYETISYYLPAIYLPKAESSDFLSALSSHLQYLNANQPILDTFRAGPLFYILAWFLDFFAGSNGYLLLKVIAPILYGFLAVAFFAFAKRGMGFDFKLSMLATIIFVFEVATLRESWDRHRTVLALVFMFAALASIKGENRWVKVGIYSLLATLSRDYVGFLLIVTVLGYAVLNTGERKASAAAMTPSIIAFTLMLNPVYLNWNSLSMSSPFFVSQEIALRDILSIFLVCYLPLLPFTLKGFFSNRVLNPMTGWLLVGSFSVLVIPTASIPGYQRWLVLLAIPIAVYAARGLQSLSSIGLGSKPIVAVSLILIVIGTGFATGMHSYTTSLKNSYIPPSLTTSSVPWEQVDELKALLTQLKEEAPPDSTLLIEERFYGWAKLFLESTTGSEVKLSVYGLNADYHPKLVGLISEGRVNIYYIWYTGSNFSEFQAAYADKTLTIFMYSGQI